MESEFLCQDLEAKLFNWFAGRLDASRIKRENKMKWNHRVVDLSAENNGEPMFGFREVSYSDDGTPDGYGEPFMISETMDGLKELIERLQKALAEPVVKLETTNENE
jgi:hypothetical protein